MTDETFISLLSKPESSILDFKSDLYNFSNDAENLVLSKFIKDIISFSNTIREGSAYIIFGIKEHPDNTKEKIGLTRNIDDAILQDKVKSKLYPLPKFSYITKRYDNLLFGILEFPLKRYEFPITSTVKLRGVEIGKVYYRQGSTNTEALSLDVIRINNWLQSLPEVEFPNSAQTVVSSLLKRLLTREETLTQIMLQVQTDPEKYRYRVQTIKVSLDKIVSINHQNIVYVKQELDKSKDFFDVPYFFKEPISLIESYLHRTDGLGTVTMRTKDVLPNYKKDYPIYGYIFNTNFQNVYQNIRQKLIDLIMELK